MARTLAQPTLKGAAQHLASNWLLSSGQKAKGSKLWLSGPEYTLQELYKFDYMDEFDFILKEVKRNLGGDRLSDFEAAAKKHFSPRDPKEHAEILAEKLAVDVDGRHLPGKIGRVQVGARPVGVQTIEVEYPWSLATRRFRGLGKESRHTFRRLSTLYWPIYAGEEEERAANSGVADPFPPATLVGAAADFTIGNETALLGLNAIVDNLDSGSGAAVIQGRTGTKPADVDTAVSGTLLFTCVMTDPAFGNASDANPGAIATAASIANDTSADATNTLGYCRVSSTNDGATPEDDHMDLNADTSGGDINFNTLSIVSGGTVSITSFTVTLPEQA